MPMEGDHQEEQGGCRGLVAGGAPWPRRQLGRNVEEELITGSQEGVVPHALCFHGERGTPQNTRFMPGLGKYRPVSRPPLQAKNWLGPVKFSGQGLVAAITADSLSSRHRPISINVEAHGLAEDGPGTSSKV
jgi:hypothetical protein